MIKQKSIIKKREHSLAKELKSHRAKELSSRRGQLLVEALIALSILTVGLMGVFGLLAQSFQLNNVVVDNYKASYLAAEGIEIVKNIIDHNNILNLNHEQQCGCSSKVVAWNQGFSDGNYEADYTSDHLVSASGQPLKFDATNELYSYTFGTPTIFKRTIVIQLIGADEMSVKSTVSWGEGLLSQSQVALGDTFYNWWP